MSLLLKLPFISSIANFVTGKKRLLCEYGLIAAVVTIGGFTLSQWYSKSQLEKRLVNAELQVEAMQSRVTIVEAVNQAHEATLDSLRELRARDAAALKGLIEDYKTLTMRDQQVRNQLYELRKSNESVAAYLAQPVPSELARLLNSTAPNAP